MKSIVSLILDPKWLKGDIIDSNDIAWPGGSRRPANWTLQDYVDQWNQYATAISQNLTGKDSMQLFQGCAFTAPRDVSENMKIWNVEHAETDGMRSNKAKTVADHDVSTQKLNEGMSNSWQE